MDNLRPIISGIIGAVAATAIMSWLARDAASVRTDGVLRYGRKTRVLAVAAFVFALFVCYAALHARPDQRIIAAVVAVAFLAIGVGMVVEAFSFQGRVTDTHLIVRTAWRGVREIPWEAIEGYSFSEQSQWHVLHTRGYGKVRLSVLLEGLDQLAEKLEEHLGVTSSRE